MPRPKLTAELKEDKRIKAVFDDIANYEALSALKNLEGGKSLIKLLKSDISASVDTLASSYIKAPESELRAICARLEARLGLLRVIMRAKKNSELADEYLAELVSTE